MVVGVLTCVGCEMLGKPISKMWWHNNGWEPEVPTHGRGPHPTRLKSRS